MKLISRLVNLGKKALLQEKVQGGAHYLGARTKSLFSIVRARQNMRFEDLSEYGVTAPQLRLCKGQFFKLAIFYVAMAAFLFIYMGLMLAKRHYGIALMVTGLMSICLAQAFKYHFWYFQIRQQKLGCTVSQWLKFVLREKDDVRAQSYPD
jgi:intracellular multiplication protein IcmV